MRNRLRFGVAGCVLLLSVGGLLCAPQHPTIQVVIASYGLNVDKRAAGNVTKCLSSACNGKISCTFAVKDAAKAANDTTPYKYKDFDFVYRCGNQTKEGHFHNSHSKIILLSCAD
jgi:hypothetical protein